MEEGERVGPRIIRDGRLVFVAPVGARILAVMNHPSRREHAYVIVCPGLPTRRLVLDGCVVVSYDVIKVGGTQCSDG